MVRMKIRMKNAFSYIHANLSADYNYSPVSRGLLQFDLIHVQYMPLFRGKISSS